MRLRRPLPAFAAALLLSASGCASRDLGQIDETRDERDDMRGPGILAGEDGETALKWEVGADQPAAKQQSSAAAGIDEQTEFELFKEWQRMRAEGSDSAEYREFLQWLEFREFKANQ